MEAKEAMRLTKQEALSLFCFLEINYSSVLENKLAILIGHPDSELLLEMKRMFLIITILKSYKSIRVRDAIQDTTALFIRDFYRDEQGRISVNDFGFLIRFLFRFRNVRLKNEILKLKHNEAFVVYFKKCYQELAGNFPVQTQLIFN